MDELQDLRPSAPAWLKGVVLAELALVLLIAEVRTIAEVAGVVGVGALYLLVRGALLVVPFGALVGALGPAVRRRRTLTLWAASLLLLAATGAALLFSLRGMHALERTAEDLLAGTTLLALPVGIAAALYVRWTPERPAPLDLTALLDAFE